MKTCVDCGIDKPLDQYTLSTKRAGGKQYRRSRCKECHRPQYRHYARKSKYGISEDEYNKMIADQGGRCAICGSDSPGLGKSWAVDHDHSCCGSRKACSKCVRSVLCHFCNLGLGSFKDDVAALKAAIEYLEYHKGQATMGAQTRRQQPV